MNRPDRTYNLNGAFKPTLKRRADLDARQVLGRNYRRHMGGEGSRANLVMAYSHFEEAQVAQKILSFLDHAQFFRSDRFSGRNP